MPHSTTCSFGIKFAEVTAASVSIAHACLAQCETIVVRVNDVEIEFERSNLYETKIGCLVWTGKAKPCGTQLVVTRYNGIMWGFSSSSRGALRFIEKNDEVRVYACP